MTENIQATEHVGNGSDESGKFPDDIREALDEIRHLIQVSSLARHEQLLQAIRDLAAKPKRRSMRRTGRKAKARTSRHRRRK